MPDTNPTATNLSAASEAMPMVRHGLGDLAGHLTDIRNGLGVLRAIACEQHIEVNGEQLAWIADRLLDQVEAMETCREIMERELGSPSRQRASA